MFEWSDCRERVATRRPESLVNARQSVFRLLTRTSAGISLTANVELWLRAAGREAVAYKVTHLSSRREEVNRRCPTELQAWAVGLTEGVLSRGSRTRK